MWAADKWTEYKILDTADGEKLERWGDYTLIRPDPQVIWHKEKNQKLWDSRNAHYFRSATGGGEWKFYDLPERWQISYRDLKFNLQPFSFKHTGLFPEQAVNWDWLRDRLNDVKNKEPGRKIKVLNLFAYTGGATVAAAKAGASVTHVDASKGMVTWAKENASASGLADAPVRYITDDCKKFVEREIRRENYYDVIIMDPPSYGRGPKNEIWKLEDSLYPFVELCVNVLTDNPIAILINSYTTGLQPAVLAYILGLTAGKKFGGKITADEIGIPVAEDGLILPCGASGRWER